MTGLDEQLIKRVSKGSERALEILMRKYRARAYWWAAKFADNGIDQDEIVNNIWVTVWRKAQQFEGRSKVSTWIYEVCRTESLMWLRDKKPKADRNFDVSLFEFPFAEMQSGRLYRKEVMALTLKQMATIRPDWRCEVVKLITEERGQSPTAKSRINRGRHQLYNSIRLELGEELKEVINF